jgi:hypothetical protein
MSLMHSVALKFAFWVHSLNLRPTNLFYPLADVTKRKNGLNHTLF